MRNPRLKTSPRALLRHMHVCGLLNINDLCGFGVGAAKTPLVATYAGGLISGSNASSYSTSVTVAAGDWVIMFVEAGNSAGTLSTITFNGVSMLANPIYTFTGGCGWYRIAHPGAGTYTAAFSISAGGGNNGCIGVWTVTGTPDSWTPYDFDLNEAITNIDCPKDGVIFVGGIDSSGGADTCTVAGINVVDASSGAGGDSTSYLFGHINNDATNFPTLGATNISYALSSSGVRAVISLY